MQSEVTDQLSIGLNANIVLVVVIEKAPLA
jgi:hypothetical protein